MWRPSGIERGAEVGQTDGPRTAPRANDLASATPARHAATAHRGGERDCSHRDGGAGTYNTMFVSESRQVEEFEDRASFVVGDVAPQLTHQ
jgi:hypothetical protein